MVKGARFGAGSGDECVAGGLGVLLTGRGVVNGGGCANGDLYCCGCLRDGGGTGTGLPEAVVNSDAMLEMGLDEGGGGGNGFPDAVVKRIGCTGAGGKLRSGTGRAVDRGGRASGFPEAVVKSDAPGGIAGGAGFGEVGTAKRVRAVGGLCGVIGEGCAVVDGSRSGSCGGGGLGEPRVTGGAVSDGLVWRGVTALAAESLRWVRTVFDGGGGGDGRDSSRMARAVRSADGWRNTRGWVVGGSGVRPSAACMRRMLAVGTMSGVLECSGGAVGGAKWVALGESDRVVSPAVKRVLSGGDSALHALRLRFFSIFRR